MLIFVHFSNAIWREFPFNIRYTITKSSLIRSIWIPATIKGGSFMRKYIQKGLCLMLAVTTLVTSMTIAPIIAEEEPTVKRNIAYRRAVYQSSAFDFNQTGHLVTDGLVSNMDLLVSELGDQYGDSPSNESPKCAFDGNHNTKWLTFHGAAWLQYVFPEGEEHTVKTYAITSANDADNRDPKDWVLQGSNDGKIFVELDTRKGQDFTSRYQTKTFTVTTPGSYRYYRLNITANNGDIGTDGNTNARIQLAEFDLLDDTGATLIRSENDNDFKSIWQSKTNQNEWVYVDFGDVSRFNNVVLKWNKTGYATHYDIQTSNDAEYWDTVYYTAKGKGGIEEITFTEITAQYLRVYCRETEAPMFALSELEVYGTNSVTYSVGEMPAEQNGRQVLTGGNWTIQRGDEVRATGEQLASEYDDSAWLPATVPGTALMSYLNAGAIADPNIADQQLLISDSYFTTNYWYRNHFVIPENKKGQRVWLNFDAINWKADVFFNGQNIGNIEGAFIRGKFDVTDLVNFGEENYLAVYIQMNDTPGDVTLQNINDAGKNGGVLGADNPTIHASIGWDWVPTIRGRNVGIYEDVFLSYSQDVTMRDSWAIVDLDVENKDFSKATVKLNTILSNPSDKAVTTTVKGVINPGSIAVESDAITLNAGETKEITVDTVTIQNPELWWPNTYGEQFLYNASLVTYVGEVASDKEEFKFGVREFTYDTEQPMKIYCNGVRVVCRGGNWGMDDSNLAATPKDYDIKVRMHAEANLTMIRNWVGMTNHKAFYEACDKYGILIWDDFWLANPGDGPNPDDEAMFMENVRDKITRNRHHAAIALYCGRNEGMPPATLDTQFAAETARLDGTRHYIPHSASGTVSGFGPYSVQNPKWYFSNTGNTLHSERGLPNIPSYESMMTMLTEEYAWPINDVWGIHDFTGGSAQGGNAFQNAMKKYRNYNSLREFVDTAQMVNYENHKAMFEAMYTNGSQGILMWMSQSAWPSMVWQTYDYYYDTNAGYFGIKKANQPANLILNQNTNELWLTNTTSKEQKLTYTLTIFDVTGKQIHTSSTTETMGVDEQKMWKALPAGSGIQFIRTTVKDTAGKELADNFTWINRTNAQEYGELAKLKAVDITATEPVFTEENGVVTGKVTLTNESDTPALTIRLKTLNGQGERVLPVYYDDNYISLMPGESRTISFEFERDYLPEGDPTMAVEGWNVNSAIIREIDDSSDVMLGDVDQNGRVEANDALLALQYAVKKITLSREQQLAADVDATDGITANDALVILQYAVKKISDFPVAQKRQSISYTYPNSYADWENGLMTGNGKMGIIVFGDPLKDTVVYCDRGFNKAANINTPERTFNDVSDEMLQAIKDACVNEDWKLANDLANEAHGWQNGGDGNRHPGYKMTISIPKQGEVTDYSRICDYTTGEVKVKWQDDRGEWLRSTFVSRADNVVVQQLTAPTKGKLTCSIDLGIDSEMMMFGGMSFEQHNTTNILNFRAKYGANTGDAGYEGVTCVEVKGGSVLLEGNTLKIKDADEALLLTETEKYRAESTAEFDKKTIQTRLSQLDADYTYLLGRHAAIHTEIYNRVWVDYNATPEERLMTNEELLALQKTQNEPVAALYERIFDAGRFHFLCSGYDKAVSDLGGVWAGDTNAGWGGFYHLDANLNLQVSGGVIGDMPEVMEGYFHLNEEWADDFRVNAEKLLGCRGLLAGGNTPGAQSGLISSLNYDYPYQYVTGEEAWLLYPFWEHYLVTGDKEFLENRLYPLLREMGDFYEDFLTETEEDGTYIFAGSISPENKPGNVNYSLTNNSTFDIASARFALETLIEVCGILEKEQGTNGGVVRWRAMLEKFPEYRINDEGALAEWAWEGLEDNYGHRHASHLVGVWPYREITPEADETLYNAAQVALDMRTSSFKANIGHGVLHNALIAATLKDAETVDERLHQIVTNDFYYNGLMTSHNGNHEIQCTDTAHAVPGIMMEMLISSDEATLEFLPALPEGLSKGSISGVRGRNQTTIETLSWDLANRKVVAKIKSNIDQTLTVIERQGILDIQTTALVKSSPLGNIAREITLKAGESVTVTIILAEPPVEPENLSKGKTVTASGFDLANQTPDKAVDGQSNTRWSSQYNDNGWFMVDLGQEFELASLVMEWEAAYAKSFNIQTSLDNMTWDIAYETTSGRGGEQTIPLTGKARYVKFQGKERIAVNGTKYGYSFYEFKVFGYLQQ